MLSSDMISEILSQYSGGVPILVGFVSTCLLGSALLEWILSVVFVRQPPTTVALFCYGMFLSYICESFSLGTLAEGVRIVERTDPNVIFYVLLPIFLYESSATLNFHVFRRNLPSSLLLAGPGAIMTMILLAMAVRLISRLDWIVCFLISSVLSATDPVAVIASLHQLNAPEKLASVVDGESLLNDGAAVVFFEVFRTIMTSGGLSFSHSLWTFIRLAMGGPFVGFVVGFLISVWLRAAQALGGVQIIGVTASVYFVFFIADELHTSGVLATVSFGLFISAWAPTCFRPKIQESHLHFVKIFAHLANHLIFVLSGVVSMRIFRPFWSDGRIWINLILVYIAMNAVRGVMVGVLSPFLRRVGSDISFKEAVILIYGGLRGGVSMALAMVFEGDSGVALNTRAEVAFYIAGAVSLSLLVNGTTVETLYRRLKIYAVQNFRRAFLLKVMESIDDEYVKAVEELKFHWFFEHHPYVLDAANLLVPKLKDGYLDFYGDFHILLTPPAHVFARLNVKGIDSLSTEPKKIRANQSAIEDLETGNYNNEFMNIGSMGASLGRERSRSALVGVDGLDIDQRCWNIIATSVKMAKSQPSVTSSARGSAMLIMDEDETELISDTTNQKNNINTTDNLTNLDHHSNGNSDLSRGPSLGVKEERSHSESTPLLKDEDEKQSVSLQIKRHTYDETSVLVSTEETQHVCDTKGRSPTFAPLLMATGSLHTFAEQELLVCNMVFNTCWQSYDLMFRKHIISGTSLLTLKKAINKANHTTAEEPTNAFTAEWESIRNDLGTTKPSNAIFNMWKSDFERILHDMEVLFAFINANMDLMKAGGFEVECLLGASLLDSYKRRMVQAKQELSRLRDHYFNHYIMGLTIIATNMSLNVKELIVSVEMDRGILLEEDEEKIIDVLEQQRLALDAFISQGAEIQSM
ncbi:sodium/hydrogen exchanger family protein [Cryptosporidium muris RN66]|uniref:Sodium/hydrogen exchanger family protein n=1 Tax=Cryptosporidium muris (strain RN66) TaxID=441375 RepID=B6ABP5_CRYMR|nr:sodium/hydrogen exchanger family protein [Cryptosporidium muris RN66]EEA05797.1 sodium/hydrogen exchanger family protein [Cryptosporidium muris RN66]|eukprot:XP_002140146.1 sodium/hydrogen exchanger family protein [Cryptosporidium muris RN66]